MQLYNLAYIFPLSKIPHCLHLFLYSISNALLKIKRYNSFPFTNVNHVKTPAREKWQIGKTGPYQQKIQNRHETDYYISGWLNIEPVQHPENKEVAVNFHPLCYSHQFWYVRMVMTKVFLEESLNLFVTQIGCKRILSAECLLSVCFIILLAAISSVL